MPLNSLFRCHLFTLVSAQLRLYCLYGCSGVYLLLAGGRSVVVYVEIRLSSYFHTVMILQKILSNDLIVNIITKYPIYSKWSRSKQTFVI